MLEMGVGFWGSWLPSVIQERRCRPKLCRFKVPVVADGGRAPPVRSFFLACEEGSEFTSFWVFLLRGQVRCVSAL